MIRYRRNINCLTTDQLHDLREALAEMFTLPGGAKNSYEYIAGLHGNPPPTWCIHGSPGFLTWHRAYMAVYEDALRSIRPNVSLPYWNWSSGPTTGVPAACASPTYVDRNGDTVPNPLFAGPIAAAAGGGTTSRRPDIATTTFGDLATGAQSAMANGDFAMFESQLNGVHGSVHVRVGGNMGSVATAGFDPIFYLHHGNVDRLWANWQAAHAVPLPPGEANLTLDPFKKCFSDDMLTGAEVFSTDDLGYRYANFCLIPLPWIVLEVVRIERLPDWARRFQTARLRVVADKMPMHSVELRFFAGGGEGRFDADTPTRDNPSFLGSLGLFGMALPGEAMPEGMGRRGEKIDLQVDVTEPLRKALRGEERAQLTVVPVTVDGKGIEREKFERIWKPERLELVVE
jgi:Common central domain of tyrosinase